MAYAASVMPATRSDPIQRGWYSRSHRAGGNIAVTRGDGRLSRRPRAGHLLASRARFAAPSSFSVSFPTFG